MCPLCRKTFTIHDIIINNIDENEPSKSVDSVDSVDSFDSFDFSNTNILN